MTKQQQFSAIGWGWDNTTPPPRQVDGWTTRDQRALVLGIPCLPFALLRSLLETVKYNLGLITTQNGYKNNIQDIRDVPCSIENFKGFPAVNIFITTKPGVTLIGEGDYTQHQDTYLSLDFFMNAGNNTILAQESILEDVQRRFGSVYWLPDDQSLDHASNMNYLGCLPFGIVSTAPRCGISIEYKIDRHYKSSNPEVEV